VTKKNRCNRTCALPSQERRDFWAVTVVRRLVAAGTSCDGWYRAGSDRSGFDREARSLEWLPGQLGDAEATRGLVRQADAVVHAAVQWEGPRNRGRGSHGASEVFMGVNLTGSLQLFQAAFEANVPRFVFLSTLRCPRGYPR